MLTKKLSKSLPKQVELLPPSYLTVMIENLFYFIERQESLMPSCVIAKNSLVQHLGSSLACSMRSRVSMLKKQTTPKTFMEVFILTQ